MHYRKLLIVVTGCLLGLAAGSARAGVVGLEFDNIGATWTADRSMGYEFTVHAPLEVTELGVYDHNADGLQGAHDAGLWTDTGTLLATTTIAAGTADPLVGHFRWHALDAPVVLTTGQDYVVGAILVESLPNDPYSRAPSGLVTAPRISYITARWAAATSLTYPGTTNPNIGYWGGNIMYNPIPEPAGLGFIGMALLTLRKRRHRKL